MFDANDFVLINKKFNLNYDDTKVLALLYQPIIDSKGLGIYYLLCNINNYLKINDLLDILNININDFNNYYHKLEGINLINTYLDNKDQYLINLIKPLSYKSFIDDGILGLYLESLIGNNLYHKIIDLFKDDNNLNKYKNITKSFTDVYNFEINNPSKTHSNYFNNEEIKINVLNIIDFYYYEKTFKIELNNLQKDKINKLCFIYNIDTDTLIKLSNNIINNNELINYDTIKNEVTNLHNLLRNKEETINDLNLKNDLEKYQNLNPLDIINSILNRKAFVSEMNVIEKIISEYDLTKGFFNILLVYVLRKTNKIPSYNYFKKVLESWQQEGIKSDFEALKYITSNKINYNKKTKKKTNEENYEFLDEYIKDIVGEKNE